MVITVVSNFLFCFFSLEIEIELELYGLRKEVLLKQEELAHNPEPESNLIFIHILHPIFCLAFLYSLMKNGKRQNRLESIWLWLLTTHYQGFHYFGGKNFILEME